MRAYEVGDPVRFKLAITVAGAATDGGTVALQVKKPDGSMVSPNPTVAHDALGAYSAVATLDQPGVWVVKWTVTGTGAGVQFHRVFARTPAF